MAPENLFRHIIFDVLLIIQGYQICIKLLIEVAIVLKEFTKTYEDEVSNELK